LSSAQPTGNRPAKPLGPGPGRGLRQPAARSLAAIAALCLGLLLCWLVLAGCGSPGNGTAERGLPGTATQAAEEDPTAPATAQPPAVDLAIPPGGLSVAPLPVRAGYPFSLTVVIQNQRDQPAVDVPLLVYIAPSDKEISYSPFVQVLSVTLEPSQTLPVQVPVAWNLAGGEHRLGAEVNRLPLAWQDRYALQPEANLADNVAQLDLLVEPFSAYTSDLCPGRVDVEIGPEDILALPGEQRVWVLVHNAGNQAVYNLPIVIVGRDVTGIAYTPALPPCGGAASVEVPLSRPLSDGELLTVEVNPPGWTSFEEDDHENNVLAASVSPAGEGSQPARAGLVEYDFRLDAAEIELPQPWLAVVRVHNQGSRDAADVPISVENQSGRKVTDAIPLVRGQGIGVAAIKIGYVWTRGGSLTFTINPPDGAGAYPEEDRDDNVAILETP
jgi:hypothetical protein